MIFKKVLLLLVFTFSLVANEVYFLPNQSKKAYENIEDLITNSKSSIDIAVYNFEYKKISKLLKKQAKNGVEISIVFDKEKIKNKKSQYKKLCETKNIYCKVINDKKQHIKLIIFDKKIAVFGSLNLTKDSFEKNHELLFITDKKKVVNKLNDGFSDILKY